MRGLIYDYTVRPMTKEWYREVLSRLDKGTRLLDVGIGTGGALLANKDLILERNIKVTGVDIDERYVQRCERNIQKAGLSHAVYFSASYMLMERPSDVLRHVSQLIKPDGVIVFTQTFQEHRSSLMEKAKPLLYKVTTIHFGRVTYEEDFLLEAEKGGLKILANEVLSKSWRRSERHVIGQPKSAGVHQESLVLS
jgi:2-polyprenyl-3-methyl-5-hydroxy-6-metoxy-1,4-benzoquinol methylase